MPELSTLLFIVLLVSPALLDLVIEKRDDQPSDANRYCQDDAKDLEPFAALISWWLLSEFEAVRAMLGMQGCHAVISCLTESGLGHVTI